VNPEWIMSGLLAVITALLIAQWSNQREYLREIDDRFNRVKDRIDKLDDRVQTKVKKADCEKHIEKCVRGPNWDQFKRHSHHGLPPDSAVIER